MEGELERQSLNILRQLKQETLVQLWAFIASCMYVVPRYTNYTKDSIIAQILQPLGLVNLSSNTNFVTNQT